MQQGNYISKDVVGHVTVLTLSRPPYNYFTPDVIGELLTCLQEQDDNPQCRAIVLAAEGKAFSAGAEFGQGELNPQTYIDMVSELYVQAMPLYRIRKPMVAAVQGAAIGAGLGLALVADFRVTCEEAKFSANFNRIGLHPGFGLTVTLPRLVGQNTAELLTYTGRRVAGRDAVQLGLANQLVERSKVRSAAIELATEIASSGPKALQDTRASFRAGLADEVIAVNRQELALQIEHFSGAEFKEGVTAYSARRSPEFDDV